MPKQKHKAFIKILNPSGSPYTTLKRALWYVSTSKASWEGSAIRLSSNYIEQCKASSAGPKLASLASIERDKRAYRLRKMDEAGYDAIHSMTLDQIQGLPVAGDATKMIQLGPRRYTPRAPHCKILVA